MKEYRISLNELMFTNLCKSGFMLQKGELGTYNINITKMDLKDLSEGKIITKDYSPDVIKIALQDIGSELIREIIKRSPIYSDMYYEM
jgi:hypothetical protein